MTLSIGWLGSVTAFLTVAIVGWASPDERIWAGVYSALQATIWFVVVPFAVLSLLSGIVVSLITRWGLTRHYWVLMKLIFTVLATGALALHTRVVDVGAQAALDPDMHFDAIRLQLVIDSAAALVVLFAITVLGFLKPRGTTPWANRPAT